MNFRQKMLDHGYNPPAHIPPSKFVRFAAPGKKASNESAYCKLFADGRAGIFGDWVSGQQFTWHEEGRSLTHGEFAALQVEIKESQRKAEREREEGYTKAAKRAVDIWASSKAIPLPCYHNYAVKKTIDPWSARIFGDSLIVPVYADFGKIISLQSIGSTGNKKFLPGCKTKGGFCLIHHLETQHITEIFKHPEILICEGYATGCSLYQELGRPVFVAFNASNLKSVAKFVRDKFPKKKLVICADNDHSKPINTGVLKGTEAAQAVHACLRYPDFSQWGNPIDATDYNDYFNLGGEPCQI